MAVHIHSDHLVTATCNYPW